MAARSVPLTMRWPASATWRKIAAEPITKVGVPGRRSASTYWIAEPTVTISSSDACSPIDHSLRTYSSGARRLSLVTKASVLPWLRNSASASRALGVGVWSTQTHPSRSSSTWS